MKPLKDLTDQTFGDWKVIHRGPNTKQGQAQWICICTKCNCLRIVRGYHLRSGDSTKCKECHNKSFNRRHGQYKTSTYRIWEAMIRRCTNPSDESYGDYGERGIVVCESWKNDFVNFWMDMGNRPKNLTLERIDNNKGYCKENCIWVDRSAQQKNTRRSHRPGNIYGDWRLIENFSYSKKSCFACIRCGRQRIDETYYVTSGSAASCKCK